MSRMGELHAERADHAEPDPPRAICARCGTGLYAHEGWRCPACLDELLSGGRPGMSREAIHTVIDVGLLTIAVIVAFHVL